MDPVDATGPMRIVLVAFPDDATAARVGRGAIERRLAACVQRVPIRSEYEWQGRLESASEVLVLFKTVPKRVGALFRWVRERHPYEVPEIVEIDVPRVDGRYLDYLVGTLDPGAPTAAGTPPRARPTRRGSRRGRGASGPRGTRGPPPRPSRRTGTTR